MARAPRWLKARPALPLKRPPRGYMHRGRALTFVGEHLSPAHVSWRRQEQGECPGTGANGDHGLVLEIKFYWDTHSRLIPLRLVYAVRAVGQLQQAPRGHRSQKCLLSGSLPQSPPPPPHEVRLRMVLPAEQGDLPGASGGSRLRLATSGESLGGVAHPPALGLRGNAHGSRFGDHTRLSLHRGIWLRGHPWLTSSSCHSPG